MSHPNYAIQCRTETPIRLSKRYAPHPSDISVRGSRRDGKSHPQRDDRPRTEALATHNTAAGYVGTVDLLPNGLLITREQTFSAIARIVPSEGEPRNPSSKNGRDTPAIIRGFDNKNRLDSSMALRKLAQGGRPSKGPRHTFNVKPDITRAEKLRDILEILECNAVDYLTPLVAAHIDSIDLEKFRAEHTQETLPIAKAS